MPNLKGMNVEALMKLRNQVDESRRGDRGRRGNCARDHRLLAALDRLMMGLEVPIAALAWPIFDGGQDRDCCRAVGLDIELR
jgi:hypothetical protein